ncbi:MAG: flagellar assembly protein FliW [Nitrospiraceae bacterium]|nr:MAG: flagellar assembly protein FliW [Nitrospiraceae bacterium]
MIKVQTSRFGELAVREDRVVSFPSGLIGLPRLQRFFLIDHKDTPLSWLQAVDDPDIAFIVASPTLIVQDYSLNLDSSVKKYIELQNDDDLAVLVTVRVEGDDVIANFQGPLAINSRTMKGVQVVLDQTPESPREPGSPL